MVDKDNLFFICGVASAVCGVLGFFKWKEIDAIIQKIQKLKDQRVYSPNEISDIIERDQSLANKLFQPSSDGNSLIGREMIIQGTINNKDFISSLISEGVTDLVSRLNYDFHYYRDSEFYEILSDKNLEKYFDQKKINQCQNKPCSIMSVITLTSGEKDCLALIQSGMTRIETSCFDHQEYKIAHKNPFMLAKVWNTCWFGLASLISAVSGFDFKRLLCFSVRIDNCEVGIKNKSVISVFGDLVYDIQTKKITVPNPLRLIKNKVGILSELAIKGNKKLLSTNFLLVSSIALAAVSFCMLYEAVQAKDYLIIFKTKVKVPQFILRFMRNIQKKLGQKPQLKMPGNQKNINIDNLLFLENAYKHPNENMQCIICITNCRSVIIFPCFHCSMCFQCYCNLNNKLCPVCKTPIINRILLYQDKKQNNNQVNQ